MISSEVKGRATRTVGKPSSLRDIRAEIEAKRVADIIRFRTCCADPRASK